MATNQTSPALTINAPEPKERAPLYLPCPCCAEKEVVIDLNLSDLETFTCAECSTEFTADDVREFIASWSKVLRAIDAMAAVLAE